MTPTAFALYAAEHFPLPDVVLRRGVERLCDSTRDKLDALPRDAEAAFVAAMKDFPIAEHTDAANAQHYELPAAFFGLVLGPRRKYSCCLYASPKDTISDAEDRALALTEAHAGLADGQDILELGCGWGSLTLWMAERLPGARITAVSNSAGQREYILAQLKARGLYNVSVVTADMNSFDPDRTFDRVVSVEMFEHMANWQALLARVRGWLTPEGRLFLHVFTHRTASYRFDSRDKDDWIAQHFFTGGIMPSRALAGAFGDLFTIDAQWHWDGIHYQRTANHWLDNFDANRLAIDEILAVHYGAQARVWRRRWRLFFLATAGLFGNDEGRAWGVDHYRLAPVP